MNETTNNPLQQQPVISGKPSVPSAVAAPVLPMSTTTTPVVTPIQTPVNEGVPPVSPVGPRKLNIPKIDFKQIPTMLKKMPKKFKIMGGFVLLLLILLILASFTKKGRQVTQLILPSPSPIPASSPVGEVLIPTQYATDTEVLDIEKTLNTFDGNLSGTSLSEDSLRIPVLDYGVDFTKK